MGRFLLESARGFKLFLNFLDGLIGVEIVVVGVGVEVEVGWGWVEVVGWEGP